MADKQAPIGICDFCGGPIPRSEWYTRRGPRLYCSVDCKNTANSRVGAPIRSRKAKERVRRGEWQNPHHIHPPTSEEQSRRSRLARTREVESGRWRNPALTDKARAKLSRPRKHTGALHKALEKLRRGSMIDLTDAERKAYLRWRHELRQARLQDVRRYYRDRYRKQQESLTPAEHEAQRAKWREQNKRRKK